MSQPEWMQKFKQIGLKSHEDEEVAEDKFSKFEKRQSSAANANIPEWLKKKSERKIGEFPTPGSSKPAPPPARSDEEEDAAALFAAAASKPAQKKADDDEDAAALFAAAGSAPAAAPAQSGGLTAEEEEMVEKYKKMFKMGMPEGAVIQKMSVDEVPKNVQDAVLAPAPEPAQPGGLTAEEEEMVEKYKKMFKMGMPEGAVIQKMSVDEVPKHVQDAVLAPAPVDEPPTEASGPQKLTPEEEEMVTKYKKMFSMGMPEGAVIQKMSVDEVPKHVQDAVLAPAPVEETSAESEVIEEEIIEEDIVVEESVVEESVVSSTIVEESVMSESVTRGSGSSPSATELANVAANTGESDGQPTNSAQSGQKMTDEEFGDPWVVDRKSFIHELSTARFEDVSVGRDTGNVHYEEVYIDENGNEVVIPSDQNQMEEDIEEEEILVDEEGNEINEEEVEYAAPTSTFSAVKEEEVVLSAQVQASKDGQILQDEEVDEPPEPPYDPDYDVENQIKLLNKGSKKFRSRMSPCVPYIFLFAIIVAAIMILFFVILADDDGIDPQNMPTAAPTPKMFAPLDPTNTGAIDVAATTPLDPVTGNCDFSNSVQPHVIDQCECTGSIDIVAEDVRQRYESLLDSFMPSVIPNFDEDISSCDPSNQALIWLSSGINNGGEAQAFVRRQRYVLAYFYMDSRGTGWTDNSLWLSEQDVCLWDRVTCDSSGRVISLDVSDNNVIGSLSVAPSLLEDLELFSVARNSLIGFIPSELFSTPKLRSLDLSSNRLSGEMSPLPGSTTLEIINLASNSLSGEIEPSFGKFTSLASLNVADNSFNGTIPLDLFSLPLLELYLAPNLLTGTIPEGIDGLSALRALTLGPNKFTGDIPTSIGNLNNLTQLIIEDIPDLSGRLPAEFGIGLTNLVEFVLRETDVRGNIPQQFGLMTALEVLDLGRNSLGRALPSELGLMTSLRILRLDNNAFSGTLPNEIGNAMEMVELQLQVNQLSGTIPSSIGMMQNLETLILDSNFLEGRAPEEICDLRQNRLGEFTVDCPQRANDVVVTGVICSIPSCCTECF